MHLGEKIRAARETLGLTKYAAAAQVGISATYWGKIEENKSVPTVDVASRIKRVLKMSADTFFETSDQEVLTPGELDAAIEKEAKQIFSIAHSSYNDDSVLDLKKLKYGQKKAVLKFLQTAVGKPAEGDQPHEKRLSRKARSPKPTGSG